MDCVLIVVAVAVMLWFVFLRGPGPRLPPGPRPLPIIGNLHQLGKKNPYETLRQLAETYGPLMSIRLGSVYTVVASTPEMAMALLQRHGQVFSGRYVPHAMEACGFSKLSMTFGPAGKEWRDKRKMCKEIVFSERCLEGSEALRQEMLQKLVDEVNVHCDCGDVVNVHDAVFMANLDLLLGSRHHLLHHLPGHRRGVEEAHGRFLLLVRSQHRRLLPHSQALGSAGDPAQGGVELGETLGQIL